MPHYTYTARTKSGEKVEGALEAHDQCSLLAQLETRGLFPISVKESQMLLDGDKKGKKPGRFRLNIKTSAAPRMPMRDMLMFTRELSDLISSGMTLGHALHTLSLRKTGKSQDTIVAQLRDDIMQGTGLSDAMTKHPRTFSSLYISMVRAGEASGRLAESLEQLCYHYERVQEAREKVTMALVYPLIVLGVGVGTVAFCMIFVVPRFESIFASLGSKLPLMTQMLIGFSKLLVNYGWFILIGIVILFILFQRTIKTPAGRLAWHNFLLRMPVVNHVVTANAFNHFASTLGALLDNGVPILDALSIVEDTVGNVIIAREIREARNRVTDGSTISGPLAQGKVFPRLLTDMLAVGEESGRVGASLKHIAKRYDNELTRSIKILTTVLEPLLMVMMAVLVGFVVISMLLAVFDLTSGLNA